MQRTELDLSPDTLAEMSLTVDALVRLKIELCRLWGADDGIVLTLYGTAMLLQELFDNNSTDEERAAIYKKHTA